MTNEEKELSKTIYNGLLDSEWNKKMTVKPLGQNLQPEDWTKVEPESPITSTDVGSSISDPVNHPAHYTNGDIECIDAIRASMTASEFLGYCKGNALKYIWRYKYKGGVEDIRKAKWYLNRMEDVLEKREFDKRKE